MLEAKKEVFTYCSGTGSTKCYTCIRLAESAQFFHLRQSCCFEILKAFPHCVENYALNLVWMQFSHRVSLALGLLIPHQKHHDHMIQITVSCQLTLLGQTFPKYLRLALQYQDSEMSIYASELKAKNHFLALQPTSIKQHASII